MLEIWIHNEKRRYYKFAIYCDLLGDRVLLRNWGSMDSRVGGSMTQVINNKQQEQSLITSIRKKRLLHDYQLVTKEESDNDTANS